MKYKTREEAQRGADLENMGLDYSFAYVVQEGDYFIIKIK